MKRYLGHLTLAVAGFEFFGDAWTAAFPTEGRGYTKTEMLPSEGGVLAVSMQLKNHQWTRIHANKPVWQGFEGRKVFTVQWLHF
jgi:hypothetical protein